MAKDRLYLHDQLIGILGSSKVYFQQPTMMSYPCIVYKLDDIEAVHANDKQYWNMKRYLVTVIDKDPDTLIPDKLLTLPYCSFETYFVANNLNHYIYSIYY